MSLRRASRIFNDVGKRCSIVMGQNNSRQDSGGDSKGEKMIEDRGQLCARFAEVARIRCLSEEERTSLKAVFEYFAIKGDIENYWTEAMFREFLSGALPSDVASILDATPLLFYSVLRIGSYPYHNYPRLTTRLTYDVLSVAIIICQGRYNHREVWGELGLKYNDVYTDDAQKLRRVLFQSLVENRLYTAKEHRGNDDDEDLIEATLLLTLVNESGEEDSGPRVPPHSSFPCTDSRRLDGKIVEAHFKSWLRLLVVTQYVDENLAPSLTTVADWKSLETVTDSMMAAFMTHESSAYSSDVSWTAFDSVINKAMPNLLTSFEHLFTPFLKPDILTTTIMKPLPPLPDDQPTRRTTRFSLSSSRRSHTSKSSVSSLSSISSIFSSSSAHSSASAHSSSSAHSTESSHSSASRTIAPSPSPSPTSPTTLRTSPISTSLSPAPTKQPRPPTAHNNLNTLITIHRILTYPQLYQLSSFLPPSWPPISSDPFALYTGIPSSFTPEVFKRVIKNWTRPAVMLVSEQRNSTPLAVDFGGRRVWGCFFPGLRGAKGRGRGRGRSRGRGSSSLEEELEEESLEGQEKNQNDNNDEADEEDITTRTTAFIFQLSPHHRIWRSRIPRPCKSGSGSKHNHRSNFGLGERMTGLKRPRLEMGLVEEDEGRVRLVLSDSLKVGCLTRTSGMTAKGGPGRVAQDNFGVDWIEVWGF